MVWFATTPDTFIFETIFALITPVTVLVQVLLEATLLLVTLETNPVLMFILVTGCVLKVNFKEITKLSSVFEKMM